MLLRHRLERRLCKASCVKRKRLFKWKEALNIYLIQGILQEELQDGSEASSTAVAFAGSYCHFLKSLRGGLEVSVGGSEELLVLFAERILGLDQHLLHLLRRQHLQGPQAYLKLYATILGSHDLWNYATFI